LLPTFIIFFRETLEASLVVGIILAYLHRIGRQDRTASVWFGVGVAVALDLAVAMISYHLIHQYDGSRVQAILEGCTYVVATAMLTYMSFWMKGQSSQIRGELERKVDIALSRGSLGAMVLLSAVTVGREGLETAFFTLAIALNQQGLPMLFGAFLGLLAGLGVSAWVYSLGRRAPLGLFFNVLGVLLLLFGAGLLADAVESFQSIGWLRFLTGIVWHSQALLSEESPLGDILHSLFGYAQAPTVLQVGVYVAFLAVAVIAYLSLTGTRRRPRAAEVRE
jgi:high-affinity iron transporter